MESAADVNPRDPAAPTAPPESIRPRASQNASTVSREYGISSRSASIGFSVPVFSRFTQPCSWTTQQVWRRCAGSRRDEIRRLGEAIGQQTLLN